MTATRPRGSRPRTHDVDVVADQAASGPLHRLHRKSRTNSAVISISVWVMGSNSSSTPTANHGPCFST